MNALDQRRAIEIYADALRNGKDIFQSFLDAGYSVAEAALYSEPTSENVACQLCDDQGQIGLPGKWKFCNCETGQRMKAEQLAATYAHSKLPERYQPYTFKTWATLPKKAQEGKRLGWAAAALFAKRAGHWFTLNECYEALGHQPPVDDDTQRNALVLYGSYGTGKTGLASAIVNELLGRVELEYSRVGTLIQNIQSAYGLKSYELDFDDRPENIIKHYATVPVLILDEFGGEHWKPDRRDIMESIIRARCASKLPFVATTNHSPDSFAEEWGNRTTEVMLESAHWIPVEGQSLRQKSRAVQAI